MQKFVKDMINRVTSFATRVYGKRSHKYEKLVKCVEESARILEKTVSLDTERNICIPGM
ncbi:MAG: hypothetical protein QW101_08010 [Ignisphaera sp.]